MNAADGWRSRAAADFACEKAPGCGRSVVVANHPRAAAAGLEILSAGGNAVDAAVATLLALTVVEPMMVGIAGGGILHMHAPDGRHIIVDAMSAAPGEAHAEVYEPVSDDPARRMETVERRSAYGPSAVAVPGNLLGWERAHAEAGRLPFSDLVAGAIRLAEDGFSVTHYLSGAISERASDIAADAEMASVFLPGGAPPPFGHRLRQPQYADALRLVADEGARALHGGSLGDALVARIREGRATDGCLSTEDLVSFDTPVRNPIVGTYRGYDIAGPPPPASSGVHVTQMLNIIEHFDVASAGFGTPAGLGVLIEVIAKGMADRAAASGDPAFVDVPVKRYTSKEYAARCWERIGTDTPVPPATPESRNTTHVTVVDRDGMTVTATHTLNGIFGACFMVPGAGFVPNNYMMNFDPHPGRALSVAPGKRVPTSAAPLIVLKGGKPWIALGLPGGVRIFTSAFQAILNLIDHGMTLQEAVEAPRLWTDGHSIEVEELYGEAAAAALRSGARPVRVMPHVGGGMCAARCRR